MVSLPCSGFCAFRDEPVSGLALSNGCFATGFLAAHACHTTQARNWLSAEILYVGSPLLRHNLVDLNVMLNGLSMALSKVLQAGAVIVFQLLSFARQLVTPFRLRRK